MVNILAKIPISSPVLKIPVLAAFFGAAAQLKPNNMEEISARK